MMQRASARAGGEDYRPLYDDEDDDQHLLRPSHDAIALATIPGHYGDATRHSAEFAGHHDNDAGASEERLTQPNVALLGSGSSAAKSSPEETGPTVRDVKLAFSTPAPSYREDDVSRRSTKVDLNARVPSIISVGEDGNRREKVHWLWSWHKEMFSAFFSLLCFGVIVFTLGKFEDVPRSHWTFPVSINLILAVFTTAMRASLVYPVSQSISQIKWLRFATGPRSLAEVERFDLASRGAWGSLRLLFGQFFREDRSYTATLGALVTVAAAALSPFSQAVVPLKTCHYTLAQPARIPYATTYTKQGFYVDERVWGLDAAAQADLYVGLVDPPQNSSTLINADCATGNCTFPTSPDGAVFSTLSMCHQCRNISDQVRLRDNDMVMYTEWELPPDRVVVHHENLLSCTVKQPRNTTSPWFEFECLMLNYDSTRKVRDQPFAVGCQLSPCIRDYAANVTNHRYTETQIGEPVMVEQRKYDRSESQSTNAKAFQFYTLRTSTLHEGAWTSCVASKTESEWHTERWDDGSATVGSKVLWYPKGCIFGAAFNSLEPMRQFLIDRLLHRNVTLNGAEGAELSNGDVWLQRVYNLGDANLAGFEDLAEGMSYSIAALMRQPTDRQRRAWALGSTTQTDTCIGIYWQWLTFPASLLLLQFGLLAFTIHRGRKARWRGDWKSSQLPLLFNGPLHDGEVIGAAKEASVRDMYARAKPLKFQLVRDAEASGGWRLHNATGGLGEEARYTDR